MTQACGAQHSIAGCGATAPSSPTRKEEGGTKVRGGTGVEEEKKKKEGKEVGNIHRVTLGGGGEVCGEKCGGGVVLHVALTDGGLVECHTCWPVASPRRDPVVAVVGGVRLSAVVSALVV